jgi:hypothetical protein
LPVYRDRCTGDDNREDDSTHDRASAIDSMFGVRRRIVDGAANLWGVH